MHFPALHLPHHPLPTKKKSPLKKFLIFQKMERSRSNIKDILIFSENILIFPENVFAPKHFLYFLKRKLLLCFRKWTPALFSLSSRNKASLPIENVLYFSKRKYRKKLLIFFFLYSKKRKRRKNYLYFRKRKFCQLFKKIFKPLSNL